MHHIPKGRENPVSHTWCQMLDVIAGATMMKDTKGLIQLRRRKFYYMTYTACTRRMIMWEAIPIVECVEDGRTLKDLSAVNTSVAESVERGRLHGPYILDKDTARVGLQLLQRAGDGTNVRCSLKFWISLVQDWWTPTQLRTLLRFLKFDWWEGNRRVGQAVYDH